MRSRGCGRSVIVIVRGVACRIVQRRVRSARIAGTRVRRSRRAGRETRRLLRRAGLFARRVVGDLVAIVDRPLARVEFVARIQNGLTRSKRARVWATVDVVGVAVRASRGTKKERGRNGQIGKRFHNLTDHKRSFGRVRVRAPTLVVRSTDQAHLGRTTTTTQPTFADTVDGRSNRRTRGTVRTKIRRSKLVVAGARVDAPRRMDPRRTNRSTGRASPFGLPPKPLRAACSPRPCRGSRRRRRHRWCEGRRRRPRPRLPEARRCSVGRRRSCGHREARSGTRERADRPQAEQTPEGGLRAPWTARRRPRGPLA